MYMNAHVAMVAKFQAVVKKMTCEELLEEQIRAAKASSAANFGDCKKNAYVSAIMGERIARNCTLTK
jgi:hypothetical protein